ncbi:MAG TPA: glycosyltransferase [Terriglobales bacterium]|nr:glycosyltransferase [Terriglobales bacterium]
MKLFVFGSSLTSSYWNGAATYYRGIYKNLSRLGFEVVFAEPDAYGRQQKRDIGEIDYADVRVYQSPDGIAKLIAQACDADLVIKHSGVGVDDDLLEREVLGCRSARTRVAFWDVDAPATLARVEGDSHHPFRSLVPLYDFIFTYGGGEPVIERYRRLGARNCHPIYNGLDPETHHPVAADSGVRCDLAFVGHRLPDREQRVQDFFFAAAEMAPEMKFILGGEGWEGRAIPANVRWIGHVGSADHNRINCSARMVLNINRQSMADVGFSPPTRVFEAAGAGACLITDAWSGIERFFAPDTEILVASSAREIVEKLRQAGPDECVEIGNAMRRRALRDHTYELRVQEFQKVVQASLECPLQTGVRLEANSSLQPNA